MQQYHMTSKQIDINCKTAVRPLFTVPGHYVMVVLTDWGSKISFNLGWLNFVSDYEFAIEACKRKYYGFEFEIFSPHDVFCFGIQAPIDHGTALGLPEVSNTY